MKYTDEERQWVIDYPDYPSWVIVEAFKEKFGKDMSNRRVSQLRVAARGATNKHWGRGGGDEASSIKWHATLNDNLDFEAWL